MMGGAPSFESTAQSGAKSGNAYAYNTAPFSVGGAAQTPVNMLSNALPMVMALGVVWLITQRK
jgi:hypothetical protein